MTEGLVRMVRLVRMEGGKREDGDKPSYIHLQGGKPPWRGYTNMNANTNSNKKTNNNTNKNTNMNKNANIDSYTNAKTNLNSNTNVFSLPREQVPYHPSNLFWNMNTRF